MFKTRYQVRFTHCERARTTADECYQVGSNTAAVRPGRNPDTETNENSSIPSWANEPPDEGESVAEA